MAILKGELLRTHFAAFRVLDFTSIKIQAKKFKEEPNLSSRDRNRVSKVNYNKLFNGRS